MLVATQQDFYIQTYARHSIYNPIPRKVRECSLVDETWVMCSKTAGLEYLPFPNVQCLKTLGSVVHGGYLSASPQTWAHGVADITC
jgi:hypothetical protein